MEVPLIVVIVVVAIVVILAVSLLVILITRKKPEDIGKNKIDEITSKLEIALKGVETKVVESTGSVEKSMLKDLAGVRETLVKITSDLETGKKLEKELEESSRRIEAIVVGARARGGAGENILEEALKRFPPQIVERNFKVSGHSVEYALVLADGKRVPIDSKWTTPELIKTLESEGDPAKREAITKQIEQALLDKVKEVTKYIDPSITVPWGIAAVPDSVFAVCRDVHPGAFHKYRVIVMPYSLTIIYLLTLYQLHSQYSQSVDVERLKAHLNEMERDLEKLDNELENKVNRGATMVKNAYDECKSIIGKMRIYLKVLPPGGEAKQLEPGEKSETENNVDTGGEVKT